MNNPFNIRMRAFKDSLEEEKLDGFVIAGETNILYFTGFLDGVRLLIQRGGENLLYVHGVNYEAARTTAKGCRIERLERGEDVDLRVAARIKGLGLGRLGFDAVDASAYLKLTGALKDVKLGAQGRLVWELRRVKDGSELECMGRAAELTGEGAKTALEILRPGLREYEVAAEIEYAMRRLGSDGVAFDTIVASGLRSALPHGGCTDREIRRGDLVVIDVGAKYRHYRADLTRTMVAGRPSPQQKRIFEVVREAQERSLKSIRAGVKAFAADRVARKLIEGAGYGEYFVHGLGHGIGLDIHEPPHLNPENEEALKAGNVVTVEPGIYIPNFGGVRIEDTVLVHGDGAERLTEAAYTLEVR